MNRKALELLYHQTTYTVHTLMQIFKLRVNQNNEDFQNWLHQNEINTWAMMTAANPYSIEQTEEKNVKLNAKFENQLQEKNLTHYYSEGIPDNLNWSIEIGFFLPNISLNSAKQLAAAVQQNAIVFGGVGATAQLIWLE
ncbi:MAG: DUF3293 domain-containing protein [Bacteroidota bacterium]